MLYQKDPTKGYQLRPNLSVTRDMEGSHPYSFSTDAQGNRIVPQPLSAGPGVVILGDSFAFGDGVATEETIAGIFGRRGFRVTNLGVPGYGTYQELIRLTEWLSVQSEPPTSIIVIVTANDESDIRASFQHMRHRPAVRTKEGRLEPLPFHLPITEWLVDHSYLFAFFRTKFKHTRLEEGNGWEAVALCLAEIKKLAESVGAKSIFVIHDARQPEAVIPFLEASARFGLHLNDVSKLLIEHKQAGSEVLLPDGHWNAEGNNVVANYLLPLISN